MISEKPGIQTPWPEINQLLYADERFEVHCANWKGYLLAPKDSSRLIVLLSLLYQKGIEIYVQERGEIDFPLAKHSVTVSARAFTQIIWNEQGIVEVGASSSLAHLHQFLFEKQQEVALEEDLLTLPKCSVAALLLSGRATHLRYRSEGLLESVMGIECVTLKGSPIKWGGNYSSPVAGPALHKLLWGLESFPGMIIKVFLKTWPIPLARLRLSWSFQQKTCLWKQLDALQRFSSSWEYLEVVLSGQITDQGFIFAQIAGLPEEMKWVSQECPAFSDASQKEERLKIKKFLTTQNLKCYPASLHHPLKPGEYLWVQNRDQTTWLLTAEPYKENYSCLPPTWKQRFWDSLII